MPVLVIGIEFSFSISIKPDAMILGAVICLGVSTYIFIFLFKSAVSKPDTEY
jgi:hypothetical protein